MKYDNAYFMEMIGKFGIEETLKRVDVEDIDDYTVKIVCRTIQHSHETLIELLNEASEETEQKQVS